ncbi:hypothetical protein B0H67DRAFT_551442 [Lasiosphaeris hirsuta]|uniref:Uncharacterized protein n=1 Tax=Lasiosphaeris hirsuta TaxID=260670 RepID=A0AA40B1T2_9PEZI|nr:hypothetical protein B0H67DRAFT_551442 [Lasiosphaeris hirsuta]
MISHLFSAELPFLRASYDTTNLQDEAQSYSMTDILGLEAEYHHYRAAVLPLPGAPLPRLPPQAYPGTPNSLPYPPRPSTPSGGRPPPLVPRPNVPSPPPTP